MAADTSKKDMNSTAEAPGTMTIHLVSPAVFRARSVNRKYERMKRSPIVSPSSARHAAAKSGRLSSVARRLLLNKIAAQSGPRAEIGAFRDANSPTFADSAFREPDSSTSANTHPEEPLNDDSDNSPTYSGLPGSAAVELPTTGRCDHSAHGCTTLSQLQVTFQQSDTHIRSSIYRDSTTGAYSLIISRNDRYSITGAGPVETPRLCIKCDSNSITFSFQVFYKSVITGPYDEDFVKLFLSQLRPQSYYVVCPGLQAYPDTIKFKTKNVRFWGEPFGRIDSQQCTLWHIPNNSKQPLDTPLHNCCSFCKRLHHDIQQLLKRALTTTSRQKEARKRVSSNYPLKYLSPAERSERIAKKSRKRKYMTSKLKEIPQIDCVLNGREDRDNMLDQLAVREVKSCDEAFSDSERELLDSDHVLLWSKCSGEEEEESAEYEEE